MNERATIELTICGKKAVDKVAKLHPERIRRLFFTAELAPHYGDACRYLAANKRIYRLVEAAELEKVAASVHHGGAAAVVELPRLAEPGPLEIGAWCGERRRLAVLDNVANGHNLGAIVRTAAFLGLRDILVAGEGESDERLLNAAAYRSAEGGMELVSLWRVPQLAAFMDRFRFDPERRLAPGASRGIAFVAADHHAKLDLARIGPELARHDGPGMAVAVVLGNEETGIRPDILKRCLLSARIAGAGGIESLNVAQAAAIFMFALGRGPAAAS